jgi:membrane protease YdiL (CAAX protease family)
MGETKMGSLMKRRPILSYFVLAYLLSWLVWVPLAIVANGPAKLPEDLFLLIFVGIYGASGAGIIMTRVVEGKGSIRRLLRRYIDWRVGLKWYGVMFFTMPVLIVTAMAIYAAQGNPIGQFQPGAWPLAFLGVLPAVLFGPLGEEAGWRGFALSRLQDKYGAFWSSILLGIVHTFWHAPLFWLPGGTPISGGPVTLVGVASFLSMVTVGTFVYTWVFNHTRGSMLMALLLHLSFNTSDVTLFSMFPDLSEAVRYHIQWELGIIPGLVIVVLLSVLFGTARLSNKPVSQNQKRHSGTINSPRSL